MIRHFTISIILLVLLFSCFVPRLTIAEQKKATGNGESGYVVQFGAFKDQKYAEQMISRLRSKGTEVFLTLKDNGMYVVQSQSFTTRAKAHALAGKLVANKLIDKYFITTTSSKTISKGSNDEGLLSIKSHMAAIDTPKEMAERDTSKAANLPVDQKTATIPGPPAVRVDVTPIFRADDTVVEKGESAPPKPSETQVEASQQKQEERAVPESEVNPAKTTPIEQGLLIREFELVKNSNNSEKYSAFVAEYDSYLQQCRMPDTFNDIASFFVRKAQPDKAIALYRTLFSCSKDQDFRIGILYSLKLLIPVRELLTMLEQERSAAAGSPEHLKKLDNFKVILLYALLKIEPDKIEELAGAILALQPGDRMALSALAWYHFHNDCYKDAYKYFSELNRIEPEQVDHVTGMIYALSGMKELEKAMELAPEVNKFFYKDSESKK